MRHLWILLAVVGCQTDETTLPPDCTEVCAEYDVTISNQSGCDETVSLEWIEGGLVVSGQPDLLGFDFGETAMAGAYTSDLHVTFDGIKAISDTSLEEQDVEGEGQADEGNQGWTIDGSVTIQTTDGSGVDCEVTADFEAVEEKH